MNEVSSILAYKGHAQAMAFARKGGAALNALLSTIAEAKQAERKGPIMTMLFLEEHFSDEEGAAIPVVGSKQGETGNLPYDRYTTEVKTADGKKKVPGSWFTDVVKLTDKWAAINQEIEWCDQGQGEGVPEHILAMGSGQRAEHKAMLRQFIADMRTGLTRGAMLYHQCNEIRLMNPATVKIKLPIMEQKGPDGKPVDVVTGNMIRLQDPSGVVEDEVVTVGSFLQYDAAAAKADPDGGTIKSLKATASKAPKSKGPVGKDAGPTIPSNLEQGKALINALASWLDNTTDDGRKVEASILTAVAKGDKEAQELIVSFGKVAMSIDSVWAVIQPAYETLTRDAATAAASKIANAK